MSDRVESSVPAAQRGRWHALLIEILKFGTVGGIAFVVDTALYNALCYSDHNILGWTFTTPDLIHGKPITSKIVATSIATVVAWLGNRVWTFKGRGQNAAHRELIIFAIMNVIGLGIALVCLGFSHYVLGFKSQLADNISGQGVGLVLGTIFRFVAYRTWVFGTPDQPEFATEPETEPTGVDMNTPAQKADSPTSAA